MNLVINILINRIERKSEILPIILVGCLTGILNCIQRAVVVSPLGSETVVGKILEIKLFPTCDKSDGLILILYS